MQRILDYLKNHGERLDTEIAAATGMSVENVRTAVSALSAKGDVMVCRSIRFRDGKREATVMKKYAMGYTDSEYEALGEFFASIK